MQANCESVSRGCWFEPITNCRAIIKGNHQNIGSFPFHCYGENCFVCERCAQIILNATTSTYANTPSLIGGLLPRASIKANSQSISSKAFGDEAMMYVGDGFTVLEQK